MTDELIGQGLQIEIKTEGAACVVFFALISVIVASSSVIFPAHYTGEILKIQAFSSLRLAKIRRAVLSKMHKGDWGFELLHALASLV